MGQKCAIRTVNKPIRWTRKSTSSSSKYKHGRVRRPWGPSWSFVKNAASEAFTRRQNVATRIADLSLSKVPLVRWNLATDVLNAGIAKQKRTESKQHVTGGDSSLSERSIRRVIKNRSLRYVDKETKSSILSDLAHSWVFMTAMLADFAVKIVEI
jgi:hypothetical protein